MNALIGVLALIIVAIATQRPAGPEQIITGALTGALIRDYMEWEFAWASDPAATEPADPPDCGPAKRAGTWFLDGINPKKPNNRECSVHVGTTIVFPITYIHAALNAKNPGECDKAVSSTRDQLVSTTGEISVILNGKTLEPSTYWRNETSECFPLKTSLTKWTDKQKWTLPVWGDAYVDGYWLALKFEKSGTHVLSLRELPRSSKESNAELPFTTYKIRVSD